MSNPFKAIEADIQAVVDWLKSEGHTQTTKLENALGHLRDHFKHDSEAVVAEVKADAAQVAAEEKPIVAEVKADAVKVADEVKADVVAAKAVVESDLASAETVNPAKK